MTTPRRTPTRLLSLATLAALFALLLVSADLHSALAGPSGASASVTPRALAEIEASIEAAASDAPVPTAGLATAIAAALTEDQKLTADDADPADLFGSSVSLSGDRALVGALGDDVDGNNSSGSAYVFAFDGTSWTQEAKLTPDDPDLGDLFGASVSLSGDRALVGAHGKDDPSLDTGFNDREPGLNAGAAYVFVFDGTSWTQEAKLTADDLAAGDGFGFSVSLSGDRALIGSPGDDDPFLSPGSAYVFAFDGTSWTQEAKLTADDRAPFDSFGQAVSLSGDHALVGAPGNDVNGIFSSGSAYVFAFDGTSWTQEAKLAADDPAPADLFGISVSLSGERALVGAFQDDDNGSESGSAYVFASDGTSWTQEAKLTAGDGAADDYFGTSVSLSGDRALVGAEALGDGNFSTAPGSAYVFAFDGTQPADAQWSQRAKLTASDGAAFDMFGTSVSLSDDHALVGADNDGVRGDFGLGSGSAYFFDLSNQPPVADAGLDQTVECTGPDGASVTLDGSGSSDPDGDALSYSWTDADGGEIATVATPTVTLGLGTHTITLTVTDPSGESDTDEVTITVEDTTAPVLTVDAPPLVLTRPNHKYVTVSLSDLGLSAADACDGTIEPGQVYVASASSDEPEDAATDDGNTLDDIVIDDCRTVRVRAERDGTGNGRVYTLTLAVADAAGNVGTATYEVQVPLSRNGDPAVRDGAAYTVDGCDASAPASASAAPSASVTEAPAAFGLEAPYPNPARGTARVAFAVEEAADVRLAVYDALGREVAVLVDRSVEAGRHEAVLDGSRLPTGTYLVRLTAGARTATQRLTLLR